MTAATNNPVSTLIRDRENPAGVLRFGVFFDGGWFSGLWGYLGAAAVSLIGAGVWLLIRACRSPRGRAAWCAAGLTRVRPSYLKIRQKVRSGFEVGVGCG